ncbi:two-component system, sensor histidine kinase YesM [Geosporobacter subterraneus DSM 17957]|uniref:Two-component system, sensor histidine kinase YesM n=1 Tax=Geosporobacter subterraneus DSM 17957 TaxID=1121919 RepID=A0A1M6NYX4_9FIRM|nr:histidine kinase [Geosporobacter subterraneus]SHK00850.1 two-component system, sensor histidine kinase YesM [Geosporobacter subterraneus DSM 17957]
MKNKRGLYLFDRIFIVLMIIGIMLLIAFLHLISSALSRGTYLFLFIYAASLAGVCYFSYKWIYRPYKESNKVLRLFHEGYIFKGVFDLRVPFNHESYLAFQKFKEIIDTKELIEGSKKHAEYLALQNQINPHFLYNTLEGIRSEALIEGVDSIANMTETLATFFRYTISNVDKLVSLEDELTNVENYYKIQKFRFGEKLDFNIDFQGDNPIEILKARIPKLTLQPIFENAIFHGVERKMGKGILTLKVTATSKRLIIIISDNGVGIEEERVRKLNKKLRGASLEYMKEDKNKGGIALLNVNNRIKLIFGDEYGIYVYSKAGAGTDVEITIPLIME